MRPSLCVIIVAATIEVSAASGSIAFYPDLKAVSPNGQFEAEAKSPNKTELQQAFQKDFTIRFRDTRKAGTIWTWQQSREDFSPIELIPTDKGYVVMLDAGHCYHVFDQKGVKHQVFDVLKALSKGDRDKYTDVSSGGVSWRQYSQQGEVMLGNKCFFYIRLYWGRTFIVSVADATLETDSELSRRVEAHVVSQTLDLIKSFNGEYFRKCSDCGERHLKSELAASVFVIKQHSLSEGNRLAEEVLKRLQDGQNDELKNYLYREGFLERLSREQQTQEAGAEKH